MTRGKRKVVVITGASAGVGRATAIAFARKGARVAMLARGRAGLAGACQDVQEAGGEALALAVDVSDADTVEVAASTVERELGPIDVWVNNAMVSVFSPVTQMNAAEYRRVTEVTYLGVVHGTLAALRRMLPRDSGSIVQVGSALAYRGIPLQSAYCAAKHAIQGFCDALRAELLHDKSGVRLTMVQLPAMNTPQFEWTKSRMPRRAQPVPPIFQPEVAARAIVWASAHDRREVLVGGPTVVAIAGNKILPGLGDRYLAGSAYDAQQTAEPENPDRDDNLWRPMDDIQDYGVHGRFGSRARGRSWQSWVTRHRVGLAAAASTLVAIGLHAGLARTGPAMETAPALSSNRPLLER